MMANDQNDATVTEVTDCVGAIDGTHIRASVSLELQGRFCGRKGWTSQNVLAAITFDLKVVYVLAGWEGSTHDSRILNDAISRPRGLQVPEGKYYLADSGYGIRSGFIPPYRGVRYHLKEYSNHEPKNEKELFNHRHSSLRSTVERGFGVLKKRFRMLGGEPYLKYELQVDVAHPTHEKYLNKKIEMHEEIALVVNKDRAKGNFAKSFNDVDLEAWPDIEPINSDDDIAIEDISKDKNAGKQSASSNETSVQPRRHRKRGHDTHDEESDIKTISKKLGQVADAITRLTWDRLDVQALHDELMKMEGCDEAFLGSAFDYLVEYERLGKAFMAKSINLRRIWLEDFSSHKF
ncbi:hypothetical protein RHSIM_Rhsim08G0145100 [Rhododendron simsii]|uniref:DDE Tnp4 domain-containing protein n=1 Tax=Rhododendron simsii TaxID=118357 RepID=A0A834LI89_RHOSS|nr:hypothetical protein RHSIM_Rhsim08G0145100 [Rhododendron simsii]